MKKTSDNTGNVGICKINIVAWAVVLILAIGLSFWASSEKIAKSYSWEGESVEISSLCGDPIMMDNVDFDAATGRFSPLNEDPWIMYSRANDQYTGVLISVQAPFDSDVETTLYWSAAGDDFLLESRKLFSRFTKGQRTCFMELPDYPVNIVRVDIDHECVIESISLSKAKVIEKNIFDSRFMLNFVIKFTLIFITLAVAYLAHRERVSKGGAPLKDIFIDPVKEGKKHLYEYDYIRTLAAILVIMMHTVGETYAPKVGMGEPGYFILKLVLALSLVCNVLYIMLSGALLLQPKEESIGEFYKNRLGRVLIPTISYFLLYMIQGYSSEVFKDGFWPGMAFIGKGLLTGRPDYMPHMWFIYAILGVYILAPFFRIMIKHITEGQLFGLILTGFILNIFSSYLPIFKIDFGIETPITGWIGVFLLGYYMTTEHAKNKYWWFMILGVLATVGTCVMVYFLPQYLYYESNWTPLMWLEGAGIFSFFFCFRSVFGKKNVVVASFAKYNFSIMLVHVLFLMKVVCPIGWQYESEHGHLRWCILGMIVVTFIMSYLFSILYDQTAIAAANYVYGKIVGKKKKEIREC